MKTLTWVILVCILAISARSEAENTIFTSSLVWRRDAKGDFVMPEINGDKKYEIPKAVPVDGIVTSMTGTWEFKGRVSLEVSADNGRNYCRVVNGKPLKNGFIAGDRIKWRATLAEDSELYEVKIAYTDSLGTSASFGEPELSNFRYRKLINILPSDIELYNYQIYVKIGEARGSDDYDVQCAGNILNDFNDIRFTLEDGETLLSYFQEEISGEAPRRTACFWIKVPQVPLEGLKICVYYGNPQAKDLSNEQDVFEMEDSESSRLRKYTAVEPEIDIFSAEAAVEEKVNLPLFKGTVIAEDARVVLKNALQKGVYATLSIPLDFDTRVIVSSWEGENVSVDVSADGGKSYRNECKKDVYYYASCGDFNPGNEITSRIWFQSAIGEAGIERIELEYTPGVITLVTPNGSEEWHRGTVNDILWSAWEYDFFYPIKIEYSQDGGRTYKEITETRNSGVYSWKIPEDISSSNMKVRISDGYDGAVKDESDRVFEVV